jgi:hypothetical protein
MPIQNAPIHRHAVDLYVPVAGILCKGDAMAARMKRESRSLAQRFMPACRKDRLDIDDEYRFKTFSFL